jgi:hypothetical protein
MQFKVKCSGVSMANVRAYLLSWSGTADQIVSDVVSAWNAAGADPTFVASWTAENVAANLPISSTVALETIENISVDTAGVKNLAVLIMVDDTDAQVGDFLEIGDVKVEEGEICTDYVNRLIAEEEDLAQEFCWVVKGTANGDAVAFGGAYANNGGYAYLRFPRRMRAAPTATVSAPGDFQFGYNGSPYACATLSASQLTRDTCSLLGTVAGTPFTQGLTVGLSHVNAAGFIIFSAEL